MMRRNTFIGDEQKKFSELASSTAEHCYSMNQGLRVAELLRSLVPEHRYEINEQWYLLLVKLAARYLKDQVRDDEEAAWNSWYV